MTENLAGRGEGLAGLVAKFDDTPLRLEERADSMQVAIYGKPHPVDGGNYAALYRGSNREFARLVVAAVNYVAALEAAAPPSTPDVFDFVGRKMATHLVETMGALEGFAEPFRAAGQSALEEFWFRATGKHIDWDSLAPEVRAEDLTAALATPSPQAPQEQCNAFSTTSAREQPSATASDNLDTATVAWAIGKICRHCRASYPDRQAKGYIANWGSVSDGDWMHAPTPQFEWRYCHASILHEALRNEIRQPAATQEQPAGSEASEPPFRKVVEWLHQRMAAAQNLPYEEGDVCLECADAVRDELQPLMEAALKLPGSPRKVGEGGAGPLMTATGPMNLADFSRHLADDIYAISDGAAPDRETLRAMIRARLEVGLKYWKWERLAARPSSAPVGEQK